MWYASAIDAYINQFLSTPLVYFLFPVPMFSKNRGEREVIIDYYANSPVQRQSVVISNAFYYHCNV